MVIFVWLLIDQITQNVCTTCLEARTFSYQNIMHAKYKKAHEKKKKEKKLGQRGKNRKGNFYLGKRLPTQAQLLDMADFYTAKL